MFIPDPTFFHPESTSKIISIFLTPKNVFKLSEIWSGLFIPESGSGSWCFTPLGSRCQKGTSSDPGSATLLKEELDRDSQKSEKTVPDPPFKWGVRNPAFGTFLYDRKKDLTNTLIKIFTFRRARTSECASSSRSSPRCPRRTSGRLWNPWLVFSNYLCICNLYSSVHDVLDACISITRASGRGLGPWIREFFGPSRQASAIWGPKT